MKTPLPKKSILSSETILILDAINYREAGYLRNGVFLIMRVLEGGRHLLLEKYKRIIKNNAGLIVVYLGNLMQKEIGTCKRLYRNANRCCNRKIEDFVIATGVTKTVRQFLEICAKN